MRIRILLCVALLLALRCGWCQGPPGPPRPEPPQAPQTPATMPVPPPMSAPPKGPQPSPPSPEAHPPTPPDYPSWMSMDFSRAAREWLDERPQVAALLSIGQLLSRPIVFVMLFVFVGVVFSVLVARAISPPVTDASQKDGRHVVRSVRLRVAKLIVWIAALSIASEAVGLQWTTALVKAVVSVLSAVLGTVSTLAVVALLALLAALLLSPHGRDALLSLLGWYYLRKHPNRPTPQEVFDLGNGVSGRIVGVEYMHTVFDVGEGKQEVRPNSWLMETRFGWGVRSGRAADSAAPQPAGSAPSPPGS